MIYVHVAVVKNINNVVVNNAETPVNKGFARVFTLPKFSKIVKNTTLSTLYLHFF